MPGLNQLKKFSEDVKDLGDESKIRLQRGETPVVIPLPEGISEEDDSEDFVLGLPEQNNSSEDEEISAMDGGSGEPSAGAAAGTREIEAFDAGDAAGESGLPDLADFLKAASGSGSGSDGADDIPELEDLDELEELDDDTGASGADGGAMEGDAASLDVPSADDTNLTNAADAVADLPELDDSTVPDFDFDSITGLEEGAPAAGDSVSGDGAGSAADSVLEAASDSDLDLSSLLAPDTADLADFADLSDFESDLDTASVDAGGAAFADGMDSAVPEGGDFDLANFASELEVPSDTADAAPAETGAADLDIDSLLGDLEAPAADGITEPAPAETAPAADDFAPVAEEVEDAASGVAEGVAAGVAPDFAADLPDFDAPAPAADAAPAETSAADLDIDSLLGDLEAPVADGITEPAPAETAPAADLDIDSLLGDLEAPAADGVTETSPATDDAFSDDGLGPASEDSDFDFDGDAIDLNADLPEEISENASAVSASAESTQSLDASDFDLDASVPMDDGASSAASGDMFADFDTSGLDDLAPQAEAPDASLEVPSDAFGGENLDFSDAAQDLASINIEDDFPVTGEGPKLPQDDFELDGNFEIPGFSDTDIADIDKKKGKRIDTPDFSKADMGRPHNSLTEDEYVQFKKNLAQYPLNLRIAIEELIVKNEFTDDAVFEVVEKVLKKLPARQIAGHMEKMLDISINVPRDFERRSVAQYEEYKKSFQYQLKNRILPGAILAVILFIIGYGLFQAGMAFVYRPVMASRLYKQGYALIQNNEYPQSEQRFKDAVAYKPVKDWFFTYARAYREHKQFERAAQMYRNILGFFKYDKAAGLEYAEMELYDRANYAKAEDLVRRNVLDHHINDPDGKLLLGDVFLEWAEVDSEKYESAKQEYLSLMQLYGATDLYMSRMMRYFIRTDHLKNVLEVKGRFYANKNRKVLSSEDWTELSGYLLDKLYGKLSRDEVSLRSSITDVLDMLEIAVKADTENPVARYNLARYFVHNGNFQMAERGLESSLDLFASAKVRTRKNTYREINAARLLGELYADEREYLKAQDVYTRGINVYNDEHAKSGLEGDENTGKLFADMGDIDYFISGDFESALLNYQTAVEMKNDTPSINFRIGAIHYNKKDFAKALGSFIKTSEERPGDPKLLLALGNTLSLRGDNYAAYGYYSELLTRLDDEKRKHDILFPQSKEDDNELVELYLKADNNLGVTLYRLARQTGNSAMNGEALVRLSDSIRAWDALTRNQVSMVRMEGSNLAAQNSKYITHPYPDYEPAIYTDISKTLTDDKVLE